MPTSRLLTSDPATALLLTAALSFFFVYGVSASLRAPRRAAGIAATAFWCVCVPLPCVIMSWSTLVGGNGSFEPTDDQQSLLQRFLSTLGSLFILTKVLSVLLFVVVLSAIKYGRRERRSQFTSYIDKHASDQLNVTATYVLGLILACNISEAVYTEFSVAGLGAGDTVSNSYRVDSTTFIHCVPNACVGLTLIAALLVYCAWGRRMSFERTPEHGYMLKCRLRWSWVLCYTVWNTKFGALMLNSSFLIAATSLFTPAIAHIAGYDWLELRAHCLHAVLLLKMALTGGILQFAATNARVDLTPIPQDCSQTHCDLLSPGSVNDETLKTEAAQRMLAAAAVATAVYLVVDLLHMRSTRQTGEDDDQLDTHEYELQNEGGHFAARVDGMGENAQDRYGTMVHKDDQHGGDDER